MSNAWILLLSFVASVAANLQQASHSVLFIVNGQTSARGRWPWQVSLQRTPGLGLWYHTCGAALITPEHILTAAHCATGLPSEYRAWFGAFDLDANDRKDSVFITAIRTHEGYNPSASGTPNDIAVMLLERPVVLSQEVQPVALPQPGEDFTQAECWITGWGKTNGSSNTSPSKLQEVRIPVISNQLCSLLMLNVVNGDINDGHICLFDNRRHSGACQGDSGGPLSCRPSASAPWELAGLTSWGVEGCPGNYPSVYTRTSHYRRWIDDAVRAYDGYTERDYSRAVNHRTSLLAIPAGLAIYISMTGHFRFI